MINQRKENRKMRIFDTWMYNGESESAYIRIWRLYEYVDFFIIMTAELTFSGHKRNVSFAPFEKELELYKDKMHVIKFPRKICYRHAYNKMDRVWCRENSERDYSIVAMREQFNLTSEDIVLISDVDEIFTREALRYIIKNPPKTFYQVKGASYYPYYFHFISDWDHAVVYRYDENNQRPTPICNSLHFLFQNY